MEKLPAVWVLAGLTAALFGLLPRFVAFFSWSALALCLLLDLFWEVDQVGESVFNLSPFAHVHPLAAEVTAVTAAWLTGVAVALTVAGWVGFRRRGVG